MFIFLTGCGGRDLTNVRTSLYGHWVSDSDTHYYFSSSGITTVSDDGKEADYSYKVLEYDEVKNVIQLELTHVELNSGFVTEYYYTDENRDNIEAITPVNSMFGAPLTAEEENDEIAKYVREVFDQQIAANDKSNVTYLKFVDTSEKH